MNIYIYICLIVSFNFDFIKGKESRIKNIYVHNVIIYLYKVIYFSGLVTLLEINIEIIRHERGLEASPLTRSRNKNIKYKQYNYLFTFFWAVHIKE